MRFSMARFFFSIAADRLHVKFRMPESNKGKLASSWESLPDKDQRRLEVHITTLKNILRTNYAFRKLLKAELPEQRKILKAAANGDPKIALFFNRVLQSAKWPSEDLLVRDRFFTLLDSRIKERDKDSDLRAVLEYSKLYCTGDREITPRTIKKAVGNGIAAVFNGYDYGRYLLSATTIVSETFQQAVEEQGRNPGKYIIHNPLSPWQLSRLKTHILKAHI